MTFPDLSTFLESLPTIQKRRKLLVFSEKVYAPTGEKVIEGFRYFACEIGPVAAAVRQGDFASLAGLPFALDEDGDRDTSSVVLDIAWTESCSFVAAQPVEYRDHAPVPVAAPVVFEGTVAQALKAHVLTLGD